MDPDNTCYICYDTADSTHPFATTPPPCACRGSIILHRTCLYSILKQRTKCSICCQPYDPTYIAAASQWKPLQEIVHQIANDLHRPYTSVYEFYHGPHIIYYPSSTTVYCRFTTHEGHMTGPFTSYYKNGQIRQQFQYLNDTLHGPQQYWLPNGKPLYYYNYVNGIPEGLQRKWYKNGTLQKSYTTHGGKRHGPYEEWYYVRHMPKIKTTYTSGKITGLYEKWYCDGTLAYTGKYNDGKKVGSHTTFYMYSGKKKTLFSYENDYQEGHQEEYHPNGRLQYSYTTRAGNRVGSSAHYNNHGQFIGVMHV